MLQIRQGVFETNSSSSHSIIIKKKDHPLDEKVDADWRIRKKDENDPKNGKLTFYWDDLEFERSPFHFLVDWYDRLCYSIASFNNKKTVDELEEICSRRLEGFKGFDFSLVGHGADKGKEYYGYVDHQSHGLLEGMLGKYHVSLENFIFNDRYVIVIDGDEYQYFQTLTEQEFFDKEAIEGIESADQWYRWDKDAENDDRITDDEDE